MLNLIENYSWVIILPVFALLFTVIWNALNRHSNFSGSISLVIAVCVSILCVISVLGGVLQVSGSSQEPASVSQKDAYLEESQQHGFGMILLPYMALMMSFLLLLTLAKIGLLADGITSFFQTSRHDNERVAKASRQGGGRRIKKYSRFLSNNNSEKSPSTLESINEKKMSR